MTKWADPTLSKEQFGQFYLVAVANGQCRGVSKGTKVTVLSRGTDFDKIRLDGSLTELWVFDRMLR